MGFVSCLVALWLVHYVSQLDGWVVGWLVSSIDEKLVSHMVGWLVTCCLDGCVAA